MASVNGIETHEDRIRVLMHAFEEEKRHRQRSITKDDGIVLLGQSAGASAVRNAATRIGIDPDLVGIVLLCQAMPRSIWFMTVPLFRAMLGHFFQLVLGRTIYPTPEEFGPLIGPVIEEERIRLIQNRQPIPGHEARTLAFLAPRLGEWHCKTLVIYGGIDQWVSTKAHQQLSKIIKHYHPSALCHEIPDVGHALLASPARDKIAQIIADWL